MDIYKTPYISPDPVYQRVNLERFTGRVWLTEQIDGFMRQHDRGYILLEAEAGVGKTSFLAYLSKSRGYMSLFVEQARGLDNMANGLQSLVAQIIRVWKLHHWFADDVQPAEALRFGFLQKLLYVAARRRDQISEGQPIVLVIDGVDLAGTFPSQNVLNLPTKLPKQVYIILSHRPVPLVLETESPRQTYVLQATDPRNLQDMRSYLEQTLSWSGVAAMLRQNHCTPEHYISTLLNTCQGAWTFLCYLVEDIEQQQYPQWDITDIPQNLNSYYARYWRSLCENHADIWESVLRPFLCTMCAIMESLPTKMIALLAGISPSPNHVQIIHDLLEKRWRRFIIIEGGHEHSYSLVDASMQDFLHQRSDISQLTPTEQVIANELYEATQQAHNRIADYYLHTWGGIEYGLPRLLEPQAHPTEKLQPAYGLVGVMVAAPPETHPHHAKEQSISLLAQNYGLRHLVAHLQEAGRIDQIHQLLKTEHITTQRLSQDNPPSDLLDWLDRLWRGWREQARTRRVLVWYAAREWQGDVSDYVDDIVQAWRLTEKSCETLQEGDEHCLIDLQCFYGLISASIHNMAHNIPSSLLTVLLQKQLWDPLQVLTYIRQMTDEDQQISALIALAPYFPESLMGDVLAIARARRDEQNRSRALAGVAPYLPPPLFDDCLHAVRAISHPAWRTKALARLAIHMAEAEQLPILNEALEATQRIWNANVVGEVLIDLAPYLPESLLQKALDLAKNIGDDDWRAQALIGMAPYLPKGLLREALSMWEVWSGYWRTKVIAKLAHRIGELGDVNIARTMSNDQYLAAALGGLAEHLPDPMLAKALQKSRTILNEKERIEALKNLAPYLPRMLIREALIVAREMQDTSYRVQALLVLMPYLLEKEKTSLIEDLFDDIQKIEDDQHRAITSAKFAEGLAEIGYLQKALAVIENIEDTQERTRALSNIAAYLPELVLHKVLDEVPKIEDATLRTQVLAKIAPYLPDSLLKSALDAARAIGDGNQRICVLAGLSRYLPKSLLQHILDSVHTLVNEHDQVIALKYLLPHLPETSLKEIFDIIHKVKREDYRAEILSVLAVHLPESALKKLLDEARSMKHEHDRAILLSNVVKYLPAPLLQSVLDEVRNIVRESDRTRVLVTLIPNLPGQLLLKVLTEVRTLKQSENQSTVLEVLTPCLARQGYWQQALDGVWGIGESNKRVVALAQLAPHLPPHAIDDILAAIRTTEQQDVRAWALATIRPYLHKEEQSFVVNDVLHAALAAKWQGEATPSRIVPLLADQQITNKVLDSIRFIENPADKVRALGEVSTLLEDIQKQRVLREALSTINLIWGEYRARALADLAPHLTENLMPEALQIAQGLEQDGWRAIALNGLLPYLSQPLKADAAIEPLKAARAIWDIGECVRALVHLVPHVPLSMQRDMLAEALAKARTIEETDQRFAMLELLVPWLVQLPRNTLYRLWLETFAILASRTRHDLLSDILVLSPVIVAIGGKQAIIQVAEGILKVGEWFT